MMWWSDGIGWGGWILMTLAMVAFWALVIFGVVALFRSTSQRSSSPTTRDEPSADRILDECFARGEIDAEEYRARKAVLRSMR